MRSSGAGGNIRQDIGAQLGSMEEHRGGHVEQLHGIDRSHVRFLEDTECGNDERGVRRIRANFNCRNRNEHRRHKQQRAPHTSSHGAGVTHHGLVLHHRWRTNIHLWHMNRLAILAPGIPAGR
jgi:hypothetical protein